ncbi:MAG: hydroxymethylbilane synthase [Syntrophobacteraceae bacterium]
MSREILRIGTRGSLLALTQSGVVRDAIQALHPSVRVELVVIKTTGDKILDVPLAKVGGKGLFVKEIEEALLSGAVDLAVHSMKDVPAEVPERLAIVVIPKREDARDALVSRGATRLDELPPGARVGTSSLRRAAQLLMFRPDLVIESLRGNLDTRLRKAEEGVFDAVVLAAAGLHRMGWKERIASYFDAEAFIPAVGQGAIGIEARKDDVELLKLLAPLHDPETAVAVAAERGFLDALQGGCQVPIGGHARVLGGEVELTGLVAATDGKTRFHAVRRGAVGDAEALGRALAQELLDAGAKVILDEVYSGASIK